MASKFREVFRKEAKNGSFLNVRMSQCFYGLQCPLIIFSEVFILPKQSKKKRLSLMVVRFASGACGKLDLDGSGSALFVGSVL